MAKSMNDLLKRRMAAAQQASELTVGEEAYEKLFEGRAETPKSRICELPIDKLLPFHTTDIGFKPYPPEKLKAFSEQLAAEGLFERVIVRPEGANYEILAGHNRTAAGKLAGWTTIPAEVVEADDDRAVVIATSTNLLRRQDLSIIERGKAYKALLEAKNRNGQHFTEENATFGENRQRYNARAIVADFFGVTEYEIRKAIKLTQLIPPLADILENRPKTLPLVCAELIADYDAASQEAFAEICSIEGCTLNKVAMLHIQKCCPPPTAARQDIFSAAREARTAEERKKQAPTRKLTFDRKRFAPYLDKLGGDREVEKLFLEFLKEKIKI